MDHDFIGIQNAGNQCWFRVHSTRRRRMLSCKRWTRKIDGMLHPYGWHYAHPLDATRFDNEEDAAAVCANLAKYMPEIDWRVVHWVEVHRIIEHDLFCPNKKKEIPWRGKRRKQS